jgi:hypothetical protein
MFFHLMHMCLSFVASVLPPVDGVKFLVVTMCFPICVLMSGKKIFGSLDQKISLNFKLILLSLF